MYGTAEATYYVPGTTPTASVIVDLARIDPARASVLRSVAGTLGQERWLRDLGDYLFECAGGHSSQGCCGRGRLGARRVTDEAGTVTGETLPWAVA
jgi:hypothetical protein